MIDKPGIYTIPAREYHADPCPEPSLSASIAKLLCLSSPAHAHYRHARLNPTAVPEVEERYDVGVACHALLLEQVDCVHIIECENWRTRAAQDARDGARAAGKIPLLRKTWNDVQAMVQAARGQLDQHTDGGAEMFRSGLPEQTLVWKEEDVWCRARLDWVRAHFTAIDDLKTTSQSANPDTWTRSLFYMGADIQVGFYLRGLKKLTGVDATFRFAVQETYPPYALSVVSLGPDALMLAEKKVIFAISRWRECLQSGDWEGYPRQTCYAALPLAHENFWLEKELR